MSRTVHIVGAGLAGLAAGIRLAGKVAAVALYEATEHAGGRCRSYEDAQSGMRIDNGTHILLSGNKAALGFLADIGATGLVSGAPSAKFPFMDLASGARWTLDLGAGRLPLWMLDPDRRAPGTRLLDYVGFARLLLPRQDAPLAGIIRCEGPVYDRTLRPFLLAALNTDPPVASGSLARAVVRETIAAGGQACRPYLAPKGLSAAFVEPAIAALEQRSATVRFGRELRRLVMAGDRIRGLDFGDSIVAVGPDDAVVLAVPPHAAAMLVPDLTVPDEYRAIINAHFRFVPPPGLPPMTGVVNAAAEWVFAFDDRICVTISDADRFLANKRDDLARTIWNDVQRVAGITAEMPAWQIVRERRATFAATPAQNRKRPGCRTAWRNLFLAGDWTDTGLPATIESAVRSGQRAAQSILQP